MTPAAGDGDDAGEEAGADRVLDLQREGREAGLQGHLVAKLALVVVAPGPHRAVAPQDQGEAIAGGGTGGGGEERDVPRRTLDPHGKARVGGGIVAELT